MIKIILSAFMFLSISCNRSGEQECKPLFKKGDVVQIVNTIAHGHTYQIMGVDTSNGGCNYYAYDKDIKQSDLYPVSSLDTGTRLLK